MAAVYYFVVSWCPQRYLIYHETYARLKRDTWTQKSGYVSSL